MKYYPYLDSRKRGEQRLHTSFIPSLITDINNHSDVIVINCFPATPKTETEELEEWREFLQQHIKHYTMVVFENVYEGNVYSCLHKIYRRLPLLRLNPMGVTFASGGLQAETIHRAYCQEYGITEPINIACVNVWEHAVSKDIRELPPVTYKETPNKNHS